MARQKTILLKAAWRRGVGVFLHQLAVTLRDSFWSQRHFIYYIPPQEAQTLRQDQGLPLNCRRILRWEDWPQELRDRLIREQDQLGWGDAEWFNQGWWVWSCEIDGDVAAFCWIYPDGTNDDFFDRMVPGSEFIWQVTTLPEFRGRGIYEQLLVALLHTRVAEDVNGLYISCRDYNSTSRRVLTKVRFRRIGRIVVNKFFGSRIWRPEVSDFQQRSAMVEQT